MPNKFKIFDSDALRNIHKRVFFSITVFFIFYSIIFYRISDIMILKKSLQNVDVSQKDEKRGKIFDRNGMLLASTIKTYSLYIHPKKINDTKDLSSKLEKILSIPQSEIKSKLSKKTNFEYIKRNISPQEHQKIINLGAIELKTEIGNLRIYPLKEVTSHIVGFTDIDGSGLSGIERGLEDKLSSGKNIDLSIDARLQDSIRNELINTVNKFSARSGLSIILDIPSGEILSMVSYPDFDPNNIDKFSPDNRFNSAIQGNYEMGSTFKPITMAMGYDKNIIHSDMLFDVSKPIKVGKKTINDYHPYDGELDIKAIIVNSSNIGIAQVARKIGKENQIEFFEKIGFFDKINLEVNETAVPLANPNYWGKTETMTIGYGHGFAITPLHLCLAYASMVNGGIKVKATLLKDKYINNYKRIIKSSTSNLVRKLLRAVILETKYTGPRSRILGYELGGKTGTAERVEFGKYNKKANRTAFISVFPMSDPKYVVLAIIDDPKKKKEENYSITAATVAVPLVKNIILNMIKILNIPAISEMNIIKASNDKYTMISENVTF